MKLYQKFGTIWSNRQIPRHGSARAVWECISHLVKPNELDEAPRVQLCAFEDAEWVLQQLEGAAAMHPTTPTGVPAPAARRRGGGAVNDLRCTIFCAGLSLGWVTSAATRCVSSRERCHRARAYRRAYRAHHDGRTAGRTDCSSVPLSMRATVPPVARRPILRFLTDLRINKMFCTAESLKNGFTPPFSVSYARRSPV